MYIWAKQDTTQDLKSIIELERKIVQLPSDKESTSNMDIEQSMLVRNRVIVRVWTSAVNIDLPGENVGHVSLEVGNRYMSLWPKQANGSSEQAAKVREGKGISHFISHEFVPNYLKEKEEYEGRRPEVTLCFYSMDTEAIKDKFDSFRNQLEGWCLLGGWCKNAESCVSFVAELLKAGKIEKLAPPAKQSFTMLGDSFRGSTYSGKAGSESRGQDSSRGAIFMMENLFGGFVKSPDSLIPILLLAKKCEWEIKPLTKKIICPSETDPDTYVQRFKVITEKRP